MKCESITTIRVSETWLLRFALSLSQLVAIVNGRGSSQLILSN